MLLLINNERTSSARTSECSRSISRVAKGKGGGLKGDAFAKFYDWCSGAQQGSVFNLGL